MRTADTGFSPEVQIKRDIQLFSPQNLPYYQRIPYNVGTQKRPLSESILLSIHNIGFKGQLAILEHVCKMPVI